MEHADPDLVRRAVAGDPDAVGHLLAGVRPLVVRYCLARLGTGSGGPMVAEDVAQDVCLTVLRVLPRYREQGRPFAAFVYGVAARKVAEAQRAARRAPELVSLDLLAEPASCAADPEELALAADASARLRLLLDRLPALQREVLILRVVLGLSAEQAAAMLGMSAGGVRTAAHRALKKLRALTGANLDEVSR
jgi:RNA polymerase sigma-70 factor (ECF subfamily)